MISLKSYALYTHQGPFLNVNEDKVDVDISNNLFLLADGFGGGIAGEKAARMSLELMKKFYINFNGDRDKTMPFFYSYKFLLEGNALLNALHSAHRLLFEKNELLPFQNRGGSAVVALALSETMASFISTGNCAIYVYREGQLRALILPDNFEMQVAGGMTHAMNLLPASGVGLFEDLYWQVKEVKIQKNDVFLMASDGLFARLSTHEILHGIQSVKLSDSEILLSLIQMANERGNLDNQSGILLRF